MEEHSCLFKCWHCSPSWASNPTLQLNKTGKLSRIMFQVLKSKGEKAVVVGRTLGKSLLVMSDAIETAFPKSSERAGQACAMLLKYPFLDWGCSGCAGKSKQGSNSTWPLLCAEANGWILWECWGWCLGFCHWICVTASRVPLSLGTTKPPLVAWNISYQCFQGISSL